MKRGITMKLKKASMILVVGLTMLGTSTVSIHAAPIAPVGSAPTAQAFLYDQYPLVGVGDTNEYYLDPTSCYVSNADSSVSALGCTIYSAAKGNDGNVPIEGLEKYNVLFTTYTSGYKRVINVNSVINSKGQNVTKDMVTNNSAFFDALFWKVVTITGPIEVWANNNAVSGNTAEE
jgi:hypothetical protein